MPQVDWNLILTSLLYAALTGVFNLIFAHKSQINAWCEAHPRLAAVLKVTRAIGLDPQHLWAALALLVVKRLPSVQTEPPASARSKAPMMPLMMLVLSAFLLSSCATWKPVVRSVNEIAKDLCIEHFGAKSKLSVEDVAKQFCETRDDLSPWLDAILAAKREAAPVAESRQ